MGFCQIRALVVGPRGWSPHPTIQLLYVLTVKIWKRFKYSVKSYSIYDHRQTHILHPYRQVTFFLYKSLYLFTSLHSFIRFPHSFIHSYASLTHSFTPFVKGKIILETLHCQKCSLYAIDSLERINDGTKVFQIVLYVCDVEIHTLEIF